jgi:hypothetical protein
VNTHEELPRFAVTRRRGGHSSVAARDFLKQLERETSPQVVQRVVLQADRLNVKAQLVKGTLLDEG